MSSGAAESKDSTKTAVIIDTGSDTGATKVAVVIDTGTGTIKFGMSGDDKRKPCVRVVFVFTLI